MKLTKERVEDAKATVKGFLGHDVPGADLELLDALAALDAYQRVEALLHDAETATFAGRNWILNAELRRALYGEE